MPEVKYEDTVFVSKHAFRRTARKAEARLEKEDPGNQYRVFPAKRGPGRFHVRRVVNAKPLASKPRARKPRA